MYYLKDHLNNVRITFADDNGDGVVGTSEIRREQNYYPFGLEHKGYNNQINGVENNYHTYVGKERNESLGLNLLEMDWRQYDPAIGRFLGIDVMAESYEDLTPYHYGNNNPILYSDPTGLFTDVVNEDTGEVYHIDDGFDFEFVVTADEFATIKEAGAIPKELRSKFFSAFLAEVGKEMKVQREDNLVSDLLHFFYYDDIGDGMVAASNKQYGAAAFSIAAGKLKKLKKLKKWIKGNKGKIPGTKKGDVEFKNREGKLPKTDKDGNPINYKEYDVNSTPAGKIRDAERMVKGSDGKVYYTDDHYKTFTEIKD